MLRGFGPSESALAHEGLLLGIATVHTGGCPRLQDGSRRYGSMAEGLLMKLKVQEYGQRSSDEAEGTGVRLKVFGRSRRFAKPEGHPEDPKLQRSPEGSGDCLKVRR